MTPSLLLCLAVPLALCVCSAAGLQEQAEWRAGLRDNVLAPERPAWVGAGHEEGDAGGGGAGAMPLVPRAEHDTMQRERRCSVGR